MLDFQPYFTVGNILSPSIPAQKDANLLPLMPQDNALANSLSSINYGAPVSQMLFVFFPIP